MSMVKLGAMQTLRITGSRLLMDTTFNDDAVYTSEEALEIVAELEEFKELIKKLDDKTIDAILRYGIK